MSGQFVSGQFAERLVAAYWQTRATVFAVSGQVALEQFDARYAPSIIRLLEHHRLAPHGSKYSLRAMMVSLERHRLVQALEAARWNQSEAARVLGLSDRVMSYKVRKFKLSTRKPRRRKRLTQPA